MLLDSIAEYLIEQHKEKEGLANYMKKSMVEVEQIWRDKKDNSLIEIENVHCDGNVGLKKNKKGIFELRLKSLLQGFELVTMENIKSGEWVACIHNHKICKDGSECIVIKKGDRFEIKEKPFEDTVVIYDGYWTPTRFFKPCLPPVEEQLNEEETNLEKLMNDLKELSKKMESAKRVQLMTGVTDSDWVIVKGVQVGKIHEQVIDNYKRLNKLYTKEQVDNMLAEKNEELYNLKNKIRELIELI